MDQWRQTCRSYVIQYSGYWHLNTCWFSNEGLPIFQTGIVVLWLCSCISNFDKLVFQFPGGKPWVGQLVTGAGKSGLPQDSTRLEAARRFPEMLHEDLRHPTQNSKTSPTEGLSAPPRALYAIVQNYWPGKQQKQNTLIRPNTIPCTAQ